MEKLKNPNTTAFKETARANAREWQARNLKQQYEKQGKDVSYEKCRQEANARGDRIDKKQDRR